MLENYDSRKGGNVKEALVQYLYSLTAGLPRAVDIMRSQLQVLSQSGERWTLTHLVDVCAVELYRLYPSEADFTLFSKAMCGCFFICDDDPTHKREICRLHEAMSVGQCIVEIDDTETAEYPVIPPLRLLTLAVAETSRGYKEAVALVQQHLALLVQHLDPKSFERFLMYHEMAMRLCRQCLQTGPYGINYSSCTLLQLYFPEKSSDDPEFSSFAWMDEPLKTEQFDFTQELQLVEDVLFPSCSDAAEWVNKVIVTPDLNQKGFEYGIILKSRSNRIVALLEHSKFTEVDTQQEIAEVKKALAKCIQGLTTNESALRWNPEDIIVLFRTNRNSCECRPDQLSGNVILMSQDTLQQYLGPTMWSLFLASEALSTLRAEHL